MTADKQLEKLGHTKVKEGPFTITYNTTYYPQEGDPKEDWSIKIDKEFKDIYLADRVIGFDEIKALYLKIKELEG
jgi:hypothetical protein